MTREEFLNQEGEKLAFFTRQILKVHGAHHPELAQVLREFVSLTNKLAENKAADITAELANLKEVTHDYEVPDDACEAYRGTYELLATFATLKG